MEFLLPALFLVVICVAIFVGVFAPRAHKKVFQELYLPITDEEFVARCSPGVNPAIALKVRGIVASFLGVEPARIHPSMTFIEDIGAA